MTPLSDLSTVNRRPARVALALALATTLVTLAAVGWLPVAESQAQTVCGQPSPTETPTGVPTGTPTENPTPPAPEPSPTSDQTPRFVTLTATREMVKTGGTVTMSGSLGTEDGTCLADARIEIMSTVLGSDDSGRPRRTSTDDEGQFEITVKVQASAEYFAVATQTPEEAEALSAPVIVLSKVIMQAKTRNANAERGTKIEIRAQVKPEHKGSTAILERKDGKKWLRVRRAQAKSAGFMYRIKAKWKGKRVFRVTWIKSDDDHEPSSSNWLRIRSKEPRDRSGRGRRGRGR